LPFAALHESASGTTRTSRNVRFPAPRKGRASAPTPGAR
jgi:hypothetical protein